MTSEYFTKHLTAEKVVQAYPLARDILGCASVEDWTAFATPLIKAESEDNPQQGPQQGIVVVERNRYIRGMFSYLVRQALNGNRVLDVQNFAVLEMTGEDRLTDELIEGVESIAEKLCCDTWFITVPKKSRWTIRRLENHGHTLEGYRFGGQKVKGNGSTA